VEISMEVDMVVEVEAWWVELLEQLQRWELGEWWGLVFSSFARILNCSYYNLLWRE
jgi:hypothetical protein